MSSTKSVLITGCSEGGIGSALVHSFSARQYRVFATARNMQKMHSLTSLPNVVLLELDVTDVEHINRAVQTVAGETGGRVDYLVNNAGRNHFMPLLDESIEDAKRIFDTNVWGPLALTKALGPLLITARGTVVNISSVSGYLNIPWMGTYAASKRSSEIMAETLRLELKPFGVRVISVITGGVKTNGLTYFSNFALPTDSLYARIESVIRGRAQGSGTSKNRLEASDFAEKVVSAVVIGKSSGVIWGPGFLPGFVRFVTAWLPTWVLIDRVLCLGFDVDQGDRHR